MFETPREGIDGNQEKVAWTCPVHGRWGGAYRSLAVATVGGGAVPGPYVGCFMETPRCQDCGKRHRGFICGFRRPWDGPIEPEPVTKPMNKGGRPSIGERAMTAAERMRRMREKARA